MDKTATPPAPFSPYSAPAAGPPQPVYEAGTVGGMLNEAWRRLSARPGLLFGACLVVWVPVDLSTTWLELAFWGQNSHSKALLLQHVLEVALTSLGSAALIFAASPASGVGTVGEALARGYASWGRLIVVRLLAFLALFAAMLACILPVFYVGVRLRFAIYAATLEGRDGTAAIRRSWELSRDRFGFLLGRSLAAYGPLIAWNLLGALAFFLGIEAVSLPGQGIVMSLLAVASSGLLVFAMICLQVVFEDRVREEAPAPDPSPAAAAVQAWV